MIGKKCLSRTALFFAALLIAGTAVAQQDDLFADEAELLEILDDEDKNELVVTLQAECRWNFHNKWGMVAFAGIGQVGEKLSHYTADNILPSAGVGLRFMLSKTTGFNISVDYAVGEDSDALYFYVGESF